ncbi:MULTISPECIES: energy transducer TonB [unclassified Rhodanobacter]|uniref:energy transducer TonB n=1 Tax=unclassified Rhodanobacter TaxID=2621553 RepID=UPI0007A9BB02|nr:MULTISPECIES: energy transducer TonB [unclassified Rhodanobacter]KZC16769.1 energy transducer TonB [Rhodanobacter sp. FW104-R8]KZC27716.1 energy transducer TonB [Rhodanobacter sp. FW510-T8]KZC33790.1 energy transducer TonB [Rhodanobacter sp. FW510-R10]
MSATATVNVDSPPDPIGATLLFSLLLHGVLLLGITFHFVKPTPSLPTLDVTLVNVANQQAPDKADFLAQANNTGGGRSDRAARPSEPFSGAIPKPDPGIAAQPVEATTPRPREATPTRMVTTSGATDFRVTSDTAQTAVDPHEQTPTAAELRRQQAIAQLAAELSRKKVDYAKRPKVKYLTASTREYAYAAYMRGWSDRVERVGNLNYPEEARSRGLHGDVLLTVVLNLDGSIKNIEVIQSSGQKVLDAAAERIVRLAAPFPPAPRSNERIDELNITRTWRFQPNNVLQTR